MVLFCILLLLNFQFSVPESAQVFAQEESIAHLFVN